MPDPAWIAPTPRGSAAEQTASGRAARQSRVFVLEEARRHGLELAVVGGVAVGQQFLDLGHRNQRPPARRDSRLLICRAGFREEVLARLGHAGQVVLVPLVHGHAGGTQNLDQALVSLGAARRLIGGAHFDGRHGPRTEVADQQIDAQAPRALQPL